MRLIPGLIVALLGLGGSVLAQEEPCRGLPSAIDSHSAATNSKVVALLVTLSAIFKKHPPDTDECAAARTVLAELTNSTKPGGRRLEKDRPLDVGEAQGQLAEAQSDTTIRGRMDELKNETTDTSVQLFLDAVVLDSQGYHSARDLRVQSLRQQLQ